MNSTQERTEKEQLKPPRMEDFRDMNDWLRAVSKYNELMGY